MIAGKRGEMRNAGERSRGQRGMKTLGIAILRESLQKRGVTIRETRHRNMKSSQPSDLKLQV